MAPDSVTGVCLTAKAGVLGYLPESWGHRVKAPTVVFAEYLLKAELACCPLIETGCTGETK